MCGGGWVWTVFLDVGRRFRLMLSCVWGPVLLTSPSLSQAVELLASILTLSHARLCGSLHDEGGDVLQCGEG